MLKSSRTLRECIEEIQDNLSTSALLRIVAEHEEWLVCAKLSRTDEQATALLFWDADAYQTARGILGELAVPESCLQLPGYRVFANMRGVIDAVSVNPGSSDAFVIPKELLGELESIARGISINRRCGDRRQ